jgi:hypothetical protein
MWPVCVLQLPLTSELLVALTEGDRWADFQMKLEEMLQVRQEAQGGLGGVMQPMSSVGIMCIQCLQFANHLQQRVLMMVGCSCMRGSGRCSFVCAGC